jgi:hypothetical protein
MNLGIGLGLTAVLAFATFLAWHGVAMLVGLFVRTVRTYL